MIAVLTGLRAEAVLVPALRVACSGGRPARARLMAETLLADGAAGLLSFGIAGGLADGLPPGSVVVGSAVIVGDRSYACDVDWSQALLRSLPTAQYGLVYGSLQVVAAPEAKQMMHSRSGALAVDMESGIAAEVCAAAGRPFAVLRAIADPVGRRIPEAALVGLTDDGRVDLWPVVSRLVRRPRDLPDLLRVGVDSRAALRALRLAVGRLGPSLGFQLA